MNETMTTTSATTPSSEQDVYLFPTSFTQQGPWIHGQLVPNSTAYHLSYALHINSALNVFAFEQSLNALIERHEVLRTTFEEREGQPVQVIHPHLMLALPVVDLADMHATRREAQILQLGNEQAQLPFDLARGPLLRTSLLRLGAGEYMLLLTIHHIIFDEWSVGVFLSELAALYQASSTHQPSHVPAPPLQYADYAVWQREWLQEEHVEEHLVYWKEQLAGAPSTLELPADRPRPAGPAGHGSLHLFTFKRHLAEAVKALSQEQGVSLFTTLIASFSTLLFRYSGQEDLPLGTVTADRGQAETEDMIGFFLNTLVLRCDLSGNPTFRELLTRIHKVVLQAMAHEDVPFEYLLKELREGRSPGRNPFFQVMLSLQPPAPVLPSGWELVPLQIQTGAALYELDLEIYERPEGLLGYLQYNADMFDEATITRMVGHWQRLLEGIVADATQRIADLPLLSDAEWRQQVVEWNATEAEYPLDRCFHELFEAQVERTPGALAVVCGQEQLTYRELNGSANALARHLQSLGVGPETLVALLAERGPAFLICMLALFKAGGAYLPLDPGHPPARMGHVLEHSGSRLVLATKDFAPLLAQTLKAMRAAPAPEVLYLEDLRCSFERSAENVPPSANPGNLAYVIYTSGSTGAPKGAMIEQRGMLNYLYAKIDALGLTANDTIAQTASQCFDISVWQFLTALLVGGRVHIFKDDVSHDPEKLLAEAEQQQISILETVPSLLRSMLEASESGEASPPRLEKLRWLVPTGEALPPAYCDRWLALYPHIPLLNAYGPTECSDDVTHFPLRRPLAQSLVTTPIGRPIPNMRLYILDRNLSPLPIGVSGELYVGGIGVGRGYLHDPLRTAEAFRADPFGNEAAGRLYKTGDLARYHPDGTIEFLGRIDHQVKLRGYRIELGEIETVLGQHAAVRQAVVLARQDAPGEKRLVAYVVLQPGHTATVVELKQQVMQALPGYMLPAAFVFLQALPLTPNGKLDRRGLPAPDASHSDDGRETCVAPRNPVEETIADIWSEVLRIEQVGIHENFFELGGHSLLIMQVISRLRSALGVEVLPTHFDEAQTVAELAACIEHLPASDTRLRTTAIQRRSRRGNGAPMTRTPGTQASEHVATKPERIHES